MRQKYLKECIHFSLKFLDLVTNNTLETYNLTFYVLEVK